MSNLPIWTWGIFNLLIGIWEIYIFINRSNLVLEKESLWEKISNGTTSINTFFVDAWAEYTKVDSRYIKQYSPTQYVWGFELTNAVLAIVFILVLFMKNGKTEKDIKSKTKWIKYILVLELINCILYFLTLGIEIINDIINNKNDSNSILNNIKQYAAGWKIPVYYLISFIWIIVPLICYYIVSRYSI